MEPDEWQRDVLASAAPRILLNVSRQAGKSTVSGVLALHRALTVPDSLVLVLAPSERQSKELFTKIARSYPAFGYGRAADSERKLGMALKNGSRIEALPGSEKTIRGFSGVDLLVVDEAARIDDDLFFAVKPMLAVSGGRLLMLSTPYGRRGAFFEAWENGGEEWERYQITATECRRISRSFLESERRAMPAFWYEQEYMCKFNDVDDAVFTYDMVVGAVTPEVEPLEFEGNAWQ
jgi:Helicase